MCSGGGVARWDDIPIRAVYNASQDDGYLGAGCRADDAASWVWCACVCGVCSRLGGLEVKLR